MENTSYSPAGMGAWDRPVEMGAGPLRSPNPFQEVSGAVALGSWKGVGGGSGLAESCQPGMNRSIEKSRDCVSSFLPAAPFPVSVLAGRRAVAT